MKILKILLIICTSNLFSQNIENVNKIIFEYNESFDTNHISKREEIIFEKDKKGNFICTLFNYKELLNYQLKLSTNRKTGFSVSKRKIVNLVKEINIERDNYTAEFIKPKLKRIKSHAIYAMLRLHENMWEFEKIKIQKTTLDSIIKKITKLADFEKFIYEKKPRKNSLCGSLHSSINSYIKFIYKKDTLQYKAEACHYICQPIILNQYKPNELRITNLNINLLLNKILPKKSIVKKKFDLNNITEGYLNWCFNRISNKQREINEENLIKSFQ